MSGIRTKCKTCERTQYEKIIFITTFLISAFVFAGAISGGGGKGVVCRDKAGQILSVQTLDLYEGRTWYGLNIPLNANETVEVLVQKARNVIPQSSRGAIDVYINSVMKGMKIIHGQALQPIDDALIVALPNGCRDEQLANYFNDKQIMVNGDLWDHLSSVEQAALILHEAIYAVERAYGATNSMRTRHVVASMFDESTHWTDIKEGLPSQYLTYFAKNGSIFWAFQDSNGYWNLQFQLLAGNTIVSKKVLSYVSSEFNFEEAKTFPILKGDEKVGLVSKTYMSVRSDFEDGDSAVITKKWEALIDSQTGQVIKGYQTPRYYLEWTSRNYPSMSVPVEQINCSLQISP